MRNLTLAVFALVLVAGCPTTSNTTDDVVQTQPPVVTPFPPGTYTGEMTATVEALANGQVVQTESQSSTVSLRIDAAGQIVGEEGAEPLHVGQAKAQSNAGLDAQATVTKIELTDTAITVTYRVNMASSVATFRGTSTETYTFTAPNTFTINGEMTLNHAGGLPMSMHQTWNGTAVLQ